MASGSYQAVVQRVIAIAAPWASAYSDSKVLAVTVVFAHVGALLVAGGFALAADRGVFRAWRASEGERARHLAELRSVHRPVVTGLLVVNLSGVLLFFADVKTYAVSVAFGVKLLLVVLLLVNGLVMTRAETALRTPAVGAEGGADRARIDAAWRRLRLTASASGLLWLATTFVGVVLSNG